jgi:hypothetical protein
LTGALALVTGETAWVAALTTGATVFVTGVVLLTGFVTRVAAGADPCEAVPVVGVVLAVEPPSVVWAAFRPLAGVPVAEGWLGVALE